MILFFSLFLTFSLSLTTSLYTSSWLLFHSLSHSFYLLYYIYTSTSLYLIHNHLALPCLLLYSGSTDRSSTKSFHLSKIARKKPVSGTPTVHSICSLPTHSTFLLFSTLSSLLYSLHFTSLLFPLSFIVYHPTIFYLFIILSFTLYLLCFNLLSFYTLPFYLLSIELTSFHLSTLSSFTPFRSGTVYPGLEIFQKGQRLQSVLEAPGVQSGNFHRYLYYYYYCCYH